MDRETYDIAVRALYLRVADPKEPQEWAMLELERGKEGKHLQILASEFGVKTLVDISDRLRDAIIEMWGALPAADVAYRRYAESIMLAMIDGEETTLKGSWRLKDLCNGLNYPEWLMGWYGVYWAHEDMTKEEFDELVLSEARQRLNGEETELMRQPYMLVDSPYRQPTGWTRVSAFLKNLFGRSR